jgi:hypothetical protein
MLQLAPSPSQQDWPPNGLVSLWEMLETRAWPFLRSVTVLTGIRARIRRVDDRPALVADEVLDSIAIDWLCSNLTYLADDLARLGARAAFIAANQALDMIRSEYLAATWKDVKRALEDIENRMLDEIKDVTFLHLTDTEKGYFKPIGRIFNEQAVLKFGIASDLDEAGKCLALGRSTACVFHLMRAMEASLRHLTKAVGCETVRAKDSWLTILNDRLEPLINSMPVGTEAEIARKKQFEQARAHLHAVRLAWRNDTMHPKDTYTVEEATELVGHVATFLRHLATLV